MSMEMSDKDVWCSQKHFMYLDWFKKDGKLIFIWKSDFCKTIVPENLIYLYCPNWNGQIIIPCCK